MYRYDLNHNVSIQRHVDCKHLTLTLCLWSKFYTSLQNRNHQDYSVFPTTHVLANSKLLNRLNID